MNCLCPKITMLSNQSCAATMWLSFSICVPFIIKNLLPLKLCGNKLTYVFFVSFVFLCRWEKRREKIYFPKSLQWYILSHLFKIYRQRLRWSRMINFDHLPATPWFFLINFFFLGTPFCHVQYHMLCHERGNAIYSQKLFTLFLKKQGKEFNFHLLLEFGQMKSGKRTRGERRRKHNCIVSCSSVCT